MFPKKKKPNKSEKPDFLDYDFIKELEDVPIQSSLDENTECLEQLFKDCSDVVIRRFEIETGIPAAVVFVDGLVKSQQVDEAVTSLMIREGDEIDIEKLTSRSVPVTQTQTVDNFGEMLVSVLGGDTGLLVEGNAKAVLLGLRGMEKRSINEPETEGVVRGPREGFIEDLRTNTSMIRRKLKSPRLKMKSMTIGRQSNTAVVVAYMDNIAKPELVEEVVRRLEKIDIDAILETGYIEELIQDSAYSPFPQLQYSERPDTVAFALLNGRVAIIVDGTPFVLLAPAVFLHFMQAAEDYYERFQMGTLVRWLRYIFLIASLVTPALYVAVTTYHQDLIPTTLLLSIAAAREAIPFPAVVETLLMEVMFEALREAGIRLPKTIGNAVSILGALVVGQAAVEAGIVSAPMVIVVSITGIASFTIPKFNGAIALRMLRFPLIIVAALFGIYGILIGGMFILGHMASLRSFGVPYLAPLAPVSSGAIREVLVRPPLWLRYRRSSFIGVLDKVSQGSELREEIISEGGQKGVNREDTGHDRETT